MMQKRNTLKVLMEAGIAADSGVDYLVLVNKLNKPSDDWESRLEMVHMTNSVGDDVEVETKAFDAYQKLKEDLERDVVYIDLDNARRSVEKQQKIMNYHE